MNLQNKSEILSANSAAFFENSDPSINIEHKKSIIETHSSSPAKYISMEDSLQSEDVFSDCHTIDQYLSRLKTFDQRGRIELIIGTMFAGKSTELLRRIRKHEISGKRVLKIKFVADQRFEDENIIDDPKRSAIVTHNGSALVAIPVEKLS